MFLALFTGPLGKYIGIGAIVLFLIAGAFGFIKIKEHEAAKAALLSFNQQQLELTIKQNKEYEKKIAELQKIADDLVVKNNELNSVVDTTSLETVQFIDNSKVSTKLDPIFNFTLDKIRDMK